jgi:hypothetical protein
MRYTALNRTNQPVRGCMILSGLALIALCALAVSPARAADFYVATNGNNLYNGRAPAWDGANGPKLTIEAAVTQANAVVGYHTVNIGTGTFFMAAAAILTRPMLILGAGIDSTALDRVTNVSTYLFNIANTNIATNSTAITPMKFKDFAIRNDNGGADKGEIVDWSGNNGLNFLQFENVSLANYRHLHYGIRPNSTTDTGNDYFTWKNFIATNVTTSVPSGNTGYRWIFARHGTSARIRQTGWVWDGCTIADNMAVHGSFGDNRWMAESWTIKNSTWSRNANRGPYALNATSDRDILGMNVISNCLIEDNGMETNGTVPGCGIYAPRLGNNASLVILDSTIRDTPAGASQAQGVYLTLPGGITNGQIRAVRTQFDGAGTVGMQIIDNGAAQTCPIELKNVDFNDCATGLAILNTALAPTNTLWYVDPAQSGATIDWGILVSGGRITYYGDANLDGTVNLEDTRLVGHPFKDIASGATWRQGDFDFDGDFDSADQAWLPPPVGALLILL